MISKACIFIVILFASLSLNAQNIDVEKSIKNQVSKPLVTHMYTADPSAHVFDGKLYIYPSHDVKQGICDDAPGGGFGMVDYHVFSIDKVGGEVKDHGEVLNVNNVPWANRMMWAPDAAEKDGKYYLYFPAKNNWGLFQIGVAVGDSPSGPFKAEPNPIKGSYSIDPSVFKDNDGSYYMYFGGIDGGQLQHYKGNTFGVHYNFPDGEEPALAPRIAKMSDDMLEFAEEPKEIQLLNKDGELLKGNDHAKRFFEAAWIHKYNGKYYFSYSTGNTHNICYAIGDNPYGPFTYQGVVLEPVIGWTNHHSICEFKGKWYLFYHDSSLSKGNTVLRSIKMVELQHDDAGKIITVNAYKQ